MRKTISFCAAFLAAFGLYSAQSDAQDYFQFQTSNGWNVYEPVLSGIPFNEAVDEAADATFNALNGHLATLESIDENRFVQGICGGGDCWIGLSDRVGVAPDASEGNWQWITGEPFNFVNWGGGEPNDSGGEDATHIRGDGAWNDHKSGYFTDEPVADAGSTDETAAPSFNFVIEYETNSPTMLPDIPVFTPPATLLDPLPGIDGADGTVGVTVYDMNGVVDIDQPITRQTGYLQEIVDGDLEANEVFTGQYEKFQLDDPTSLGGGTAQGPRENLPDDFGGDEYIVVGRGAIQVPESGIYTFWSQSDDGFGMRIKGQTPIATVNGQIDGEAIFFPNDTGNSNVRVTYDLPAGVHRWEYMGWEDGGGAFFTVDTAQGDVLTGSAQWLALGDDSELPQITKGAPVATLNGPLFIGTSSAASFDDLELVREELLEGDYDFDSNDAEHYVIDDDRGDSGGCPFGEFPESRAALGDDVPRWPNSHLGNVDNFGAIILGSLTIDDGDETPGETLDVVFHLNSDDKGSFRIVGQDFLQVTGDNIFEVDGDDAMWATGNVCNNSLSGHIQLVEGEYEFEGIMEERGGDTGQQILVTTGTFDDFDSAQFVSLSVANDDVTVIAGNKGIGFVDPSLIGVGDPCDFDGDGSLGVGDIDILRGEVKSGANNAAFDLTGDGLVDVKDIIEFVEGETKLHTWMGDANLDGEFNSTDFVNVFQAGEYDDGVPMNSTWATGDWNGDGDFDSSDFVTAFQSGGYELGPKWEGAAQVPEPSSIVLVVLGLFGFGFARRRK